VRYHDPYVAQFAHSGHGLRSEPDLAQALAAADCVVVVTDHSVYDWRQLAQMPVAIVDTRHVVG
jgi:UDP-N-acetyl-D-glucosamine dehydrogenase